MKNRVGCGGVFPRSLRLPRAAPARLGGGAEDEEACGRLCCPRPETDSVLFGPIRARDGWPKHGCWLGQMTEANSVGTGGSNEAS